MKTFNPFAVKNGAQPWVYPVSGMCLILGFMISMAFVTENTRNTRMSALQNDQRTRVNVGDLDFEALGGLQEEVQKLQKEKTLLENTLASKGSEGKVLNDALQETKILAGLTRLQGPGLVVTISDSTRPVDPQFISVDPNNGIVHDFDVLRAVNELFSAGAEAVSVNNHRVTGRVSFRCVGSTILVNDIKITTPVVLRAIGDRATLYTAMFFPNGVVSDLRAFDPGMIRIDKADKIIMEPFAGSTQFRYAKVPKDVPTK